MKLVEFNDAHIRGSTPRSRTDDYPETLWQKFQQLTKFIKKHHIEAVLNGGDLFDTPDPSTGIVNRYLQLFSSWGIPMYSIIGSHDKFGYNDKTLERTALGTLRAAGVTDIISYPTRIGEGCSIAGISHSYDLDENPEVDYYYGKDNDDYLIQMCHGMITEGTFFGKYTVYDQIRTEADLVICAHYHPGFGPYEVNDFTIINIGSMGRTENTTRHYPPGFLYIDTALPYFEFIPFDVDPNPFITKQTVGLETIIDITRFIDALKEKTGNFEKADLKSLLFTIGKDEGIPLNTIELALKYIETDDITN